MQKVLIFGIAGFVGPYLAEEFYNHGYEIVGCDKTLNSSIPKFVEAYTIDLLDSDSVARLIEKTTPNIIVNLAAISSVGASWSIPQLTMEINAVGAINIMEASRKINPMPKILFIGSSEEYSESDKPLSEDMEINGSNPYGISKIAQERFAEIYRSQYGIKIYSVRAFNHTGIGQKDTFVLPSFCKQVAEIEKSGKDGAINVGNIFVKRDFSDVRDIVRAYRMVVESDDCSQVYNIGSGKAYSLKELLDYIIGLSHRRITINVDKKRIRPTDLSYICSDTSLIRSKLGWIPKYDIFVTLKEMYLNYLNREDK